MADPVPNPDRPAFPLEYAPALGALRGLTKREAIAAMNHAALLANASFLDQCGRVAMKPAQTAAVLAEVALRHADALLAELGEPIP